MSSLSDPWQKHIQRILVVDDDPWIVRVIQTRLLMEGFEVLTARSGREALALIEHSGIPHLAIVDMIMPEMDGLTLCKKLHALADVPIIMLTGVDVENTIVQSLEGYVEDYMTKPFSPNELVARLQRVLRRVNDFSYAIGPVLKVDDRLSVDFSRKIVFVEGREVALTTMEAKLLYVLLSNPGRALDDAFLGRRLWPEGDTTANLRVYIHHLRQKLEPAPKSPRYLLTRRGEGYVFLFPGRSRPR